MRRGTGRHGRSADDVYAEHPGVPAPPARLRSAERAERVLFLAALVVVPLLVMVFLAAPAAPYWDQPDQQGVVTAAVPAGAISEGRTRCEASRYTVRGPVGRTGSFRACADARSVGDEVTVRWRSDTSDHVRVDVLTPGRIGVIGALVALACAVVGAVALYAEQRRRQRRAFPTYRTRRG
jgi:hypothetical protein